MPEETPEQKAAREAQEAEQAAKEQQEQKPPWGSDDEFDPAKAWKLVQNVRADLDKIKTERDELRTANQAAEDAKKTDDEKLSERLTGAEKRAAYADRLDVALDKAPEGMSIAQVRKLAKRLTGDTVEELQADAEELFSDFAPAKDEDETPGRTSPRETLRPGAAPSAEAEETDPRKLAAQVPRP